MKLGVIGAKLGHTASPAIHDKLFRILQVQDRSRYGVLEMDRNDIPNELQRLRREGYTGANVTIPYKLDVMPYLTDISREAASSAPSIRFILRTTVPSDTIQITAVSAGRWLMPASP